MTTEAMVRMGIGVAFDAHAPLPQRASQWTACDLDGDSVQRGKALLEIDFRTHDSFGCWRYNLTSSSALTRRLSPGLE